MLYSFHNLKPFSFPSVTSFEMKKTVCFIDLICELLDNMTHYIYLIYFEEQLKFLVVDIASFNKMRSHNDIKQAEITLLLCFKLLS